MEGQNETLLAAQVPGMSEKDVKVEASEQAVMIKGHFVEKLKLHMSSQDRILFLQ